MQAYQIQAGKTVASLEKISRPDPVPGPYQVLLQAGATALNFRDLMVAEGSYPAKSKDPVIPGSDLAGKVVAVGPGVTRWKVGDHVMPVYFTNWFDGRQTPENTRATLGGDTDGTLAELVVANEQSLVRAPAHLDSIQASTLPCAGVTAWNALFVEGALKPGDSVLLLGTGGVSIWALQLAKAAGLKVLVTSSNNEKLARAQALGADAIINYVEQPEWQEEVLRATGGRGVDLVLEVGGKGTITRSIAATRMSGTIAIIGGVTGMGGEFDTLGVIAGVKRLTGIFVGSRAMLEDLSRFVEATGIRPVIDKVFRFGEAVEAYRHLEAGRHFGKIVVARG
jgi:NADPH:quinone reductase-like Zn-dependent oxidoreductase